MGAANYFRVAGHDFCVEFAGEGRNSMLLLPSFEPFRIPESRAGALVFTLTVDDGLKPLPKAERTRVRDFETGNGNFIVDKCGGGGYQFVLKNTFGHSCALFVTGGDFKHPKCALNGTANMRTFGLNAVLMMSYAYATCKAKTLLIHASTVRHAGRGYAFTAKSGTGKSTHVAMWLRHIPGSDLMNDDNPVVRVVDGTPYIYGSPWSGKTPCYRDIGAPLGAISFVERDTDNYVERLGPAKAFAAVMQGCAAMKWDETIYGNIMGTVTDIVSAGLVATLHCRPDKEAAEVCARELAGWK